MNGIIDIMFDFVSIIVVLVIVFLSIILHEIAHGFVSYLIGDDTAKMSGRLTLNPISHIDPFMTILLPVTLALIGAPVMGGAKPVPIDPSRFRYKFNEWGLLLVAIAGPLTNLLIAFVAFGITVLTNNGPSISTLGSVLWMILGINLNLFVFNMLPIPPLDGSRILYTLAPDFVRGFLDQVEQYGVILLLLLITLGGSTFGQFIGFVTNFVLMVFAGIFGV